MRWVATQIGLAAGAVLAVSGCDQLGLGPPKAASAPAAPAPMSAPPDVRPHAGLTYQEFISQPEMERYAAEAMGLREAEAYRLSQAMASPQPAWLASGGGAEALVLTGCAAEGCGAGRAVVAIDVATGAPFVGVRDSDGEVEYAPNARVEALLRLLSPTRSWHDPAPQQRDGADTVPEAAQP